jgi:large repetitive protein
VVRQCKGTLVVLVMVMVLGALTLGLVSTAAAAQAAPAVWQPLPGLVGVAAPTVTGLDPSTGPVGTTVTITGTNFVDVSSVTFNGASAAWAVFSTTEVDAQVPAGATTGKIRVTTAAGFGDSSGNFTVEVVGPPTITSFTPTSGVVGTSVTITGTNLLATNAVRFNGVSSTDFYAASSTSVVATVPGGATTGLISLTTPTGTGTSAAAFSLLAPTVSFSPSSGVVGDTVTITGNGFNGTTSVTFGGVSASYIVNSNTQITATVPAGAPTGAVAVTASGMTGTSPTSFVVKPSITSFNPAIGPTGTVVTITGTSLGGATAVTFGGASATTFTPSASQITATVPAGAVTGFIVVTTPGGTATSSSEFVVGSVPAATVTGFSPTFGPAGTSVTISGTNFIGVTAVTFGGVAATIYNVPGATSIVATVPNGAVTGKIAVTTPGGTAQSATNFTVSAPTISSFNPTAGAVGTEVNIFGANFTGATAVRFNGTSALFDVMADDQIDADVPPGATSGPITVVTPSGSVVSAGNFTVGGAPVISSVTPSTVAAYSSSAVTLYVAGSGFESGVAQVYWNDTLMLAPASPPGGPAPNPTAQLYVTLPIVQMAVPTTATIRVKNPGSGLWSNGVTFTVAGPTISSVAPSTAANTVTSQAIEVVGQNLNLANSPGITLRGITGTSTAGVTIQATGVSLLLGSTTRISGVVNLATGGTGGVAAPAGQYDVSLTYVQDGAKSVTLAGAFAVTGAALTSIDPKTATNGASALALTLKGSGFKALVSPVVTLKGPGTTGTTVVTGTGITINTDGTAMTVTFNLTSPTVVSTGLYDVIITYGSSSTLKLAQALTVDNAIPVISLLNPSTTWAGSVKPTTLTVTGSGYVPVPALLGATGSVIRVGSRISTNTSFASSTQLTVPLIPSDVTVAGVVPVVVFNPTPGGGTSNAVNLTVSGETSLPTSTISGADLNWHNVPVTLTVNAIDAESGVQFTQYTIAGSVPSWATMTGATVTVPAPSDHSGDGSKLVRVQATDWCNKLQASPTEATVFIDTRGPTTAAGVSPSSVKKGKKLKLLYTPKDALSQTCAVTLKIKNGSGSTVKTVSLGQKRSNSQGTYSFTCNFKKGKYHYYVYATDLAGNKQTNVASKTFNVK